MKRFRLYIDESGDHTYYNLDKSDKRYLGLTGVVIQSETYRTQFHPAIEQLKQKHFPHSPDEPVIFHRKEIINRNGIFGVLTNPKKNDAFIADMICFLREQDYMLFTVVIDKKSHIDQYDNAAMHPYHYCITVLLERYRGFLITKGGKGDVLAESRGGTEDMGLKQVYKEVYESGTRFLSGASFQEVLTSREIKLKKKPNNIAGLQIADLLAHPLKQQVLIENQISEVTLSDFGKELCQCVRDKQNLYAKKFIK